MANVHRNQSRAGLATAFHPPMESIWPPLLRTCATAPWSPAAFMLSPPSSPSSRNSSLFEGRVRDYELRSTGQNSLCALQFVSGTCMTNDAGRFEMFSVDSSGKIYHLVRKGSGIRPVALEHGGREWAKYRWPRSICTVHFDRIPCDLMIPSISYYRIVNLANHVELKSTK